MIPKGVPIGRRTMRTDHRGPAPAPGLYDTPLSPGRQAQEAGKPRRKGRLRRAFVVVAALAVGLCLAGVTVGYILYDKATTPDRSSPSVTLQQYLDEKFENRDEQKAAVLVCRSPKLDAIDAMLADLKARESKFGVTIDIKSSDVVVTQKTRRRASMQILRSVQRSMASSSATSKSGTSISSRKVVGGFAPQRR